MSEERSLARQGDTLQIAQPGLTPREVVEQSQEQAKVLMDIVLAQRLYTEHQGKKYLHIEAWQTIGRFNSATAVTEWVRPVEEAGTLTGYAARVNIVRHGEIEGSAEAVCFLEGENVTKGKDGNQKRMAAMSMAQTRAASKAFRMCYSFVAVLAGYEPTPADEMDRPATRTPVTRHRPFGETVARATANPKASDEVLSEIKGLSARAKWPTTALLRHVKAEFGVDALADLTDAQANRLADYLELGGELKGD